MRSYQARLIALIILGLVPLAAIAGHSGAGAAQQARPAKAAPVMLKRAEAERTVSQLRASAAELRALARGEKVETNPLNRRRTMGDYGSRGARVPMQTANTLRQVASELEALATSWEEELESAGDDAELANIDLQNMLQKQQQTLQTISNVSKATHDTAMAVIRKIGG